MLASPLIRNYLINYARPLIYSTAMTHLSVLAVQKSLEMLEEGEADPVSLSARESRSLSCCIRSRIFSLMTLLDPVGCFASDVSATHSARLRCTCLQRGW